ncbi:MAG: hydroxyacylglutathione hydrolase [Legionellales bacterium]|nr:hydroxyacylglutathione hydrolase [Legionellales bacterium]|tara:strand:+ start:339 stop:1088 length:750 start_codon:yes stop_codon:yes gene_type:complete
MQDIFPVSALSDNYIWCFEYEPKKLCIVDPGESKPVLEFCEANNFTLGTILVTHHHWDHTDGIRECLTHFPEAKVIGPQEAASKGVQTVVTDGDKVSVGKFTFEVISIPGHTMGHIAYTNNEILFCGDTLFSGGCGRVFEGTHQQMYSSLQKLSNLADTCVIFPAHEYTENNLRFALSIEPKNKSIKSAQSKAIAQRLKNEPTLPTTMKKEKQINPFLRCHLPTYKVLIPNVTNSAEVFKHIRDLKDKF